MQDIYVDATPVKICIKYPDQRKYHEQKIKPCPSVTAEMKAIIKALKLFDGDINIFSDCQPAIKMLHKIDTHGKQEYSALKKEYDALCVGRLVKLTWVPREENKAGQRIERILSKNHKHPRVNKFVFNSF